MEADLRFAHELADAADAITLRRFRALDVRVETKPDRTPVTDADRAVEEAVRGLVAERRRGEHVLGEEGGAGSGDGASRWVVDPIDGTRYFMRGAPIWATLIALERDGVVDVGVVSAPALGRRWWAVRGDGAWADGTRCRVSEVRRIEDAIACTTSPRDMPDAWRALAKRAWVDGGVGDFWQYCLLAEGAVDLASDEVLDLWDYAAVRVIVEEAGGRCTTFTGEEPAPGASFIASNGVLHADALAVLGDTPRGQTPQQL